MNQNRRFKLLMAVLAVIVVAIVWPLWNGLNENYDRARAQARQAELRLQQALALQERIMLERAARESLEEFVQARGANFDLYSHINERIKQHGAERYAKLTSRGTSSAGRAMQAVNLEFENAPLGKLLDVLHQTYSGRNLVVLERLHHLRPSRSGEGVDCAVTLVSPQS